MKVLCTRAAKCESGATAMEYALTAAILSVVLLTGADTLGSVVNDSFMSMSKTMVMASKDTGRAASGTQRVSSQIYAAPQRLSIGHPSQPPRP